MNKTVWGIDSTQDIVKSHKLTCLFILPFMGCRHENNCQWSRTSSVVWRHTKGERGSGTSPDDYLQGWSVQAEEGEFPFKRGEGEGRQNHVWVLMDLIVLPVSASCCVTYWCFTSCVVVFIFIHCCKTWLYGVHCLGRGTLSIGFLRSSQEMRCHWFYC